MTIIQYESSSTFREYQHSSTFLPDDKLENDLFYLYIREKNYLHEYNLLRINMQP